MAALTYRLPVECRAVSRRGFLFAAAAVAGGCGTKTSETLESGVAPRTDEVTTQPNTSPLPALPTNQREERFAEAFAFRLTVDCLEYVLPFQPLVVESRIINTSETSRTLPPVRCWIIERNPESGDAVLWPRSSRGREPWFDGDTLVPEKYVAPGDCRSSDERCYLRWGPKVSLNDRIPITSTPGPFNLAIAGYSIVSDDRDPPPLIVSPSVTIEVREPKEIERGIGELLMSYHSKREIAKEGRRTQVRDWIKQLQQLLELEPESPLMADVCMCLSCLLDEAANNEEAAPDHGLLAESLKARFAISPRREVLYRMSIGPSVKGLLMDWSVQKLVDVPAFLQKLKDHPPFPDRTEFASRRKWLAQAIDEIETSFAENKRRPVPRDKKLARA